MHAEVRAPRWATATPPQGTLDWEAPATARAATAGSAELAATVRVRVMRVLAQPGDRVVVGQRLAEVEAPELLRALAARGAAITRAAPLRAWRDELAAQRDAGMVRASELRDVQSRLAEAEAERLRADAELRASGFPPSEIAALARTGRAALRAPMEGVVRSVSMVPGRVAGPEGAPLAIIASPGPVRVEVRVHGPAPDGAALRFEPVHGPSVDLDPTPVSEASDPETGARVIWFRTSRSAPTLLAGPGRVVLRELPRDLAVVPGRSLQRTRGEARLFVRVGDTPRARAVSVLSVRGDLAVVRGVAPGAEVLAEPPGDQEP